MMRSSVCVVIYAEFLIIIQYVYGIQLHAGVILFEVIIIILVKLIN